MLKLKLQYFGHLMQRTDSSEKDSDPEKDWGQEEKGTTEDEMAGWHHQLDGVGLLKHEFEQTLGVGDGQEGLVCCRHDWVTELNWTGWKILQNKEMQRYPHIKSKEESMLLRCQFSLN